MLKTEDISQLKMVKLKTIEENLAHVFSVDDFNTGKKCCGEPIYKGIDTDPWVGVKYCINCHRITTIYFQDRMGGIYQDPAEIWENPTPENPFIDFSQIHQYADFLAEHAKDKCYAPWWGDINKFKQWVRDKNKKP